MTGREDLRPAVSPTENARRLQEAADRRRGGAPMSREEALERARAASPPERAAIKSGIWARDGLVMRCSACRIAEACEWEGVDPDGLCAWERAYRDVRRPMYAQVLVAAGMDPELHGPLIDMAVSAEVRLYRAERYCAVHGEIRRHEGDHEFTGVAKQIDRLQAAVRAARQDLNLTPAAIAKLEAGRAADSLPDLVRGVLAAQQRREAGPVRDVEFEAGDEHGGDDGGA